MSDQHLFSPFLFFCFSRNSSSIREIFSGEKEKFPLYSRMSFF